MSALRRRSAAVTVAATAPLLLVLTACGSGGHPAAAPPTPAAPATDTAPTPARSPLVGGAGQSPAPAAPSAGPRGAVGTVLFARGSAAVSPNGAAVVRDAVAELRRERATRIRVLGYTDYLGGERVNATLSQQRADVVAGLLRAALGPGVAVTAEGQGKSDALDRLQTRAGPLQNRRAIILATA